jgi:flagellar hook-basal body complex protein FliE
MPGPILPISPGTLPGDIRPAGETRSGGAFPEIFANAVRDVESLGRQASGSVERFLSGEGEELHNTVLATTRAELAFEMFLQTRNKVVGAYQEIMKMQL